MITTVCLNPSFDKTANVTSLQMGEVNRLQDIRIDMGGKGLNVAVVSHRLGLEVQCIGMMGKQGSEMLSELIAKEGFSSEFIKVSGGIRTNLKLVSQIDKQVTEFNEPGEIVSQDDINAFRKMAIEKCQKSSYLVLTGSLPPGCAENTYQLLMQDMSDIPCILDTVNEKLLLGIQANPFLVKPNLSELESTVGTTLATLRTIRDAAITFIDNGAENVIVSMGSIGALFTNGSKTVFAPALKVKARSTVGAGDAMVGGVLFGLREAGNIIDAFKCGIAAGAASVMTEGTQLIRPSDFEMLLPMVKVQTV